MNKDDYYYNHLHKNTVKDKELFLRASSDIENSFTGRLDILTSGLHRFFMESSKLIRNAVKLYEEGVYDAAFYSIRSSLELARVVTYFSTNNELQDNEEYKSWRKGGKFPFDSSIRKELEASGSVYAEVHEVLKDFFDEQKSRLSAIQKYIHKQGYKTFYTTGFTNPERENIRQEMIADDFYNFLKGTLTEIGFLRLCIDPFPVLLRDDDVRLKIHFQGMTEPFGNGFVSHILGEDKIKRYCATEFYLSHVSYFEDNEDLTEEAHSLINHQFYNRESWPIVEKQLHLFSKNDIAAINMFNVSKEIAKIYMLGGFLWYFSETHSPGEYTGFSSEDLLKVKESAMKINSRYKESYMSYFNFDDGGIWIEHNEPLIESQVLSIETLLK